MGLLSTYQPAGACPKCGHGDVNTTYHPDTHAWTCVLRGDVRRPDCCKLEHLERTCRRCQYSWAEAVA